MKKLFFILFIAAFSFRSVIAADVVLNDFEAGSPTVTTSGATYAEVTNPNATGNNTTANCAKIGRTTANWWEYIQFPVSFTIPANTKKYIHILVNYQAQPDVSIRIDGSTDIRAMNNYTSYGQWQDLVFEIIGGSSNTSVTNLMYLTDLGFNNSPAGQILNNTDKFGYIDEVVLNDDFKPRGVSTADYTISTFEAAMSAPVSSTKSYATGGTTWSFTNPAPTDPLNSSAKCYQVIKVSPNPTWTGLQVVLNGWSTINSSNQYLHVMVYKTVASQIGYQYKNSAGTQSTAVWDNSQSLIFNQWTDYVYQIPPGTVIKQLNVEISASTGTFYMDNMVLNNNPLPRGGVTYMTDNNLCDFESDISTSTTIKDLYTFADASNTVTYPVANPFTTGANITSNVGKRTMPSTGVNWYTGFGFTLKTPILIDNNHKYLHVLVTVPTAGQKVNISLKQGANASSDIQKTVTLANIWQDFVVDLSSYSFISDIFVKCGDWGGVNAAGDYYFDEIKINGDPTSSSDAVISLTNGNPTMGTISGSGTFTKGVSTTVTASPNSGYRFVSWTLDTSGGAVQSTSASYPFTVSGAETLVANFVSISSDNFRSKTSGNWGDVTAWRSSPDNSTWYDVNAIPTSSAASINILSGHEITVAANATSPTLTINSGGKLTLNSGYTLGVTGNFIINSDPTLGTGTFVDQNTNGGLTVTGTSTVNQSLQAASALRTWYITPPVASDTPIPALSIIKYFDETKDTGTASDNWVPSTSMVAKVGYQVVPTTGNDISFSGTLNNGDQNISLTSRTGTDNYAGFNLIGNPYPSYLDWSLVAANTANAALMRSTTMWYRTKKLNLSSQLVYQFWTVNGDGVTSPNGASSKIPPMQAFWVRANAGGGTLALTNAMRSHAPATDLLLKAPAAKNTAKTLVRLQVSNGTNNDETVLYLSANASNGMDVYDSPKMSNNDVAIPEIYMTVGAEHMVINAMNTLPLDTPIGLGFVPGNATSFSLTANEISNLPTGLKVILKDNVTKAETDLTDGTSAYQFSPVVTSSNRFSVIFRSAGAATSVETPQDNSLIVYSNAPQQLTVICNDLHVGSMLSVYNAIGQKLLSQQLRSTRTQIEGKFTPGVYLVKVNNTTKKVIIN